MSLFGKLVKTTINVGIGLPVALTKDLFTMGNLGKNQTFTQVQLERIKDEADD